ncbi:MAG: PEP-CTERM sorting domain-containing protein [Nitrosomonas sp.]|uniref:PEP-CTERM sorting domain-containing protein n=1 Tax=Nitrosomonas sp. TaxID=42353 RepID=UPI001D58F041|nr:PEP-CTERM sorting domain-containing protein [Nitrosomonas sp.]MBX9894112.1 PEP-CTERM sorting domain-containing protein [Nitrosomonas sp.]
MNQNFSKFKQRIAGFTLLTTVLISTNTYAEWSLSFLGTLEGTDSFAVDINNLGQVVGSYSKSGIPGSRAFITGPNGIGMTALGTLDGGHTFATGINDSGQVTGSSSLSNSFDLIHSFITGPNGAGMTDLGVLHEITGEYQHVNNALDINESGQVVGYEYHRDPHSESRPELQAFMTGPNGVGITGMNVGEAKAINDSGQIVGSTTASGSLGSRAFITGPDGIGLTIIEEGLHGNSSWASAINNSGQVVINSYLPGDMRAYVTGPNGVGITALGTLGGKTSNALDINESGQIIGVSQIADGRYHAFLYSDGEMLDLSLLPAFINAGFIHMINVTAINDHGQIVGWGYPDGGSAQAFLLSPFPVPEPQTYAMLLAGLGILGFMAPRRKKLNLS